MNNLYIFDNLKSGGGKTLGLNYFKNALIRDKNSYFLLPEDKDYMLIVDTYKAHKNVIFMNNAKKSRFSIREIIRINKYIEEKNISNILNFSNIPFLNFTRNQHLMIHKAHLVIPGKNKYIKYRKGQSIRTYFEKKFIALSIKFKIVNNIILQTEFMKDYYYESYGKDIVPAIVPSGYIDSLENKFYYDPYKSSTINLFVPTSKSSHKNNFYIYHLANELKKESFKIQFHMTVLPSQKETDYIEENGLEEYIVFLGKLDSEVLPNYYRYAHGVFLPTLLESFCLPYVEGIVFGNYILTSNLPFAKEVCGKSGLYFDPYNVLSGVKTIKRFIKMGAPKIKGCKEQNPYILSWEDSYKSLMKGVE